MKLNDERAKRRAGTGHNHRASKEKKLGELFL
jgi:hypothetical protein